MHTHDLSHVPPGALQLIHMDTPRAKLSGDVNGLVLAQLYGPLMKPSERSSIPL